VEIYPQYIIVFNRSQNKSHFEDLAGKIYRLHEHKQQTQVKIAGRDELRKRIAGMGIFLREHPITLTEYDEPFVRRLIEKVTVYEDKFTVEFKSCVTVDINE
jgi:site-specific DNA recombinase